MFDRFDTLLAGSGMREANDPAAKFSIDLRDPVFWRASLDTFRADLEQYEALSWLKVDSEENRADVAPLGDSVASWP